LHYEGTAAVTHALEKLDLQSADRVLDVGSGLGGPARVLAYESGCHVTAVEMQPDLNSMAQSLTARCGLEDQVTHQRADFMTDPLPGEDFDALVSWLTFLHIPDRDRLLARCEQALKSNGRMYVEDFFARGELTVEELRLLSEEVYCEELPSLNHYRQQLESAGFEIDFIQDMSRGWSEFVARRLAVFRGDADRFTKLHGHSAFKALDRFYSVIVELFAGGNLGGMRLLAHRSV